MANLENRHIDRVLGELETQGQLDSSGSFTLSPEKFMENMAAYQFVRPYQWASKIVQAAVSSGATAISLKQSRRSTRFFIDSESSPWSLNELESALGQAEPPNSGGLRHLRLALGTVVSNFEFQTTVVLDRT
jgi:hypothetical protein